MAGKLTDSTTVPLFTVLAAAFAGIVSFGGGLMWVAAISTRAETAHARLDNVDKQLVELRAANDEALRTLKEVSASTSKIEGQVQIILQRTAK